MSSPMISITYNLIRPVLLPESSILPGPTDSTIHFPVHSSSTSSDSISSSSSSAHLRSLEVAIGEAQERMNQVLTGFIEVVGKFEGEKKDQNKKKGRKAARDDVDEEDEEDDEEDDGL